MASPKASADVVGSLHLCCHAISAAQSPHARRIAARRLIVISQASWCRHLEQLQSWRLECGCAEFAEQISGLAFDGALNAMLWRFRRAAKAMTLAVRDTHACDSESCRDSSKIFHSIGFALSLSASFDFAVRSRSPWWAAGGWGLHWRISAAGRT